MALKMILIALFTAVVAVSATSLRDMEMGLDEFAQQDMAENVMSESFEDNEPLEEEYPHEMEVESNAELMVSIYAEKEKELKNLFDEFSGKLKDLFSESCGNSYKPVTQGSLIRLEVPNEKDVVLGCSESTCIKKYCPGGFREGTKFPCRPQSLHIYRQKGPGSIHVGDTVGFTSPLIWRVWLSMFGGKGHMDRCPGSPNTANGFEQQSKWTHCGGEVFQIYARGKSIGDVIHENDDIMLYYVFGKQYVSHRERVPDLSTCPGSQHPVPSLKYDQCKTEVFKITPYSFTE